MILEIRGRNSNSTVPYGSDMSELAPGWGYWVHVSADHTWNVSY